MPSINSNFDSIKAEMKTDLNHLKLIAGEGSLGGRAVAHLKHGVNELIRFFKTGEWMSGGARGMAKLQAEIGVVMNRISIGPVDRETKNLVESRINQMKGIVHRFATIDDRYIPIEKNLNDLKKLCEKRFDYNNKTKESPRVSESRASEPKIVQKEEEKEVKVHKESIKKISVPTEDLQEAEKSRLQQFGTTVIGRRASEPAASRKGEEDKLKMRDRSASDPVAQKRVGEKEVKHKKSIKKISIPSEDLKEAEKSRLQQFGKILKGLIQDLNDYEIVKKYEFMQLNKIKEPTNDQEIKEIISKLDGHVKEMEEEEKYFNKTTKEHVNAFKELKSHYSS